MDINRPVIFISNPFGYGPTGKTIAVMEDLRKSYAGTIIYIASIKCQETLPKYLARSIKIVTANERSEVELREILSHYNNPLVICTLNRSAIKTAKSMGLEAIFIDSLTWLWKTIPDEYLMADMYYCFDIFNIRNKLPSRKNIKVISPIFGTVPDPAPNKHQYILVHIGGFSNPKQDKMSFSYLDLLQSALNTIPIKKKVVISGGNDAITYLKKNNSNPNCVFDTYGRDEFLHLVNAASHFVTTPGLTATFESFLLHTPASFLPPTNQSQWKILKLLSGLDCADFRMEWEDYTAIGENLENMDEAKSISMLQKVADEVCLNQQLRAKFICNLMSLIQNSPPITKQSEYIKSLGTNGSEVIVNDILKRLNLASIDKQS